MTGKYKTPYENMRYLVEFKHYSVKEAQRKQLDKLESPFSDELAQLEKYESDILMTFPQNRITKFVIYTIGSQGYRFFQVEDGK